MLSLLQSVQTGSGFHLASYSSVNWGVFPVGARGRSLRLSTNLYLMARLGMSGAILLFPSYGFKSCARPNFPVPVLTEYNE